MLPPEHRLRRSAEFQQVVRRGRRAGSSTLVVHGSPVPESPGQVGFVVSRAVGRAHVRNLVKRRLRHAAVAELPALVGWQFVVRAKPEAAAASFATLASDIRRCCDKVVTQR
jgi:ribonuclease P protein component